MSFLMLVLVTAQFPDTFLGSIAVGNNPVDLCISPDGQRAYAAVEWGFASAVDIQGYSEFSLAGLVGIEGEPSSVQCDETGEKLYVADTENSLVHVVNTGTLTVESSFPVEASPVDMVLCSGTNRILLSHSAGMITVINTLTSSVEDVFWAGNSLHSMTVSSDGKLVYAPDNGSPDESLITAATGSVSRFSSGMDSRAAALSGNGELLFLSCTEWDQISVMNTGDLTIETSILCENGAPVEMAALPALPYLYGVNPEMDLLSVYSTDELQFTGTVPVPGEPVNIAVHPDGERIFVVCAGDNRMKVFGYDPAGTEPEETDLSMVPGCSPSSAPSVILSGVSGTVTLRGYDLSGRNLFESEETAPNEFFLPEVPSGIVFVAAESRGERLCTQVVVLEP